MPIQDVQSNLILSENKFHGFQAHLSLASVNQMLIMSYKITKAIMNYC